MFSIRISIRIHHFRLPGPPGANSLDLGLQMLFERWFPKSSCFVPYITDAIRKMVSKMALDRTLDRRCYSKDGFHDHIFSHLFEQHLPSGRLLGIPGPPPATSRPPPGPPRASGSTKMPPFSICVLAKPAEKPYSLRAQKIKVLTAKPCGTSRKRPSKS